MREALLQFAVVGKRAGLRPVPDQLEAPGRPLGLIGRREAVNRLYWWSGQVFGTFGPTAALGCGCRACGPDLDVMPGHDAYIGTRLGRQVGTILEPLRHARGTGIVGWAARPRLPNSDQSSRSQRADSCNATSGANGSARPRQRAVPGMNCAIPCAPAGLTALASKRLSCQINRKKKDAGSSKAAAALRITSSNWPGLLGCAPLGAGAEALSRLPTGCGSPVSSRVSVARAGNVHAAIVKAAATQQPTSGLAAEIGLLHEVCIGMRRSKGEGPHDRRTGLPLLSHQLTPTGIGWRFSELVREQIVACRAAPRRTRRRGRRTPGRTPRGTRSLPLLPVFANRRRNVRGHDRPPSSVWSTSVHRTRAMRMLKAPATRFIVPLRRSLRDGLGASLSCRCS